MRSLAAASKRNNTKPKKQANGVAVLLSYFVSLV